MSDASERYAFLGMPGYGQQTAGAGRGFWRASERPARVHFRYQQGSLLGANFNALWCGALNLVRAGKRVDYFAMQHADVEPVNGWLDALITELEARDLDILGAVVPIKDPKGLTSLALAHPSGDPWRIARRLTMTEVYRLPETFTSADVGGALLLNTGLWVCRFNEEWARKVRFTINDRIVFNTETNRYEPQVEPEDWYFSRLLHELGLKIGATRKVPLAHAGETRFSNTHPWGADEYDTAWAPGPLVPQAPGGG